MNTDIAKSGVLPASLQFREIPIDQALAALAQQLARISHIVEVHRGSESEKVVLRQQLSFDLGKPRCRQSV